MHRVSSQQGDGRVVHFGVGKSEGAEAVRVLWTNGIPQNILSPKPRLTFTEKQELLKGSCPYLYTWTGEKYEFFTDLLWAAPIGLQFGEGVIMPTRDWEYLLILVIGLCPLMVNIGCKSRKSYGKQLTLIRCN